MTNEQFEKAKELRERIKQLNNFVFVISPFKIKNNTLVSGKVNADIFLNKIKSVSIFGVRDFQCCKHTEMITIPYDFIDKFADIIIEEIKRLEKELESL